LIDTYDTLAGARNAVTVGKEMAARGQRLIGVRLDSGDLAPLAVGVREILDAAGLNDVKILGSGGLDEYDLAQFSAADIPFNSYGVGTKMGTSADAPWSDMSYKMIEYAGRPVQKLSSGKISWPGKKQVFRKLDQNGKLSGDILGLRGETRSDAEPVLEKVMDNGRVIKSPPLATARECCREEFSRLDDSIKALRDPATYPVEYSDALRALQRQVGAKIKQQL
jgi:nicotinate phosphoribosyltransferase